MLLTILRPSERVTSIYHIHLDRLWEAGLRSIVTDLDNTLVEWNSAAATPKLVAWLDAVRDRGFRVCIVSNNDALRVDSFAAPLGIPSVARARKPMQGGFMKALGMVGTAPERTVMVGDQLFTDILGGNRLGMHTILVRPIHAREFIGTKVSRFFERMILSDDEVFDEEEYFYFESGK